MDRGVAHLLGNIDGQHQNNTKKRPRESETNRISVGSNDIECKICRRTIQGGEKNYESHVTGRKHHISKIFARVDYKRFVKKSDGIPLTRELFKAFLENANHPVLSYGYEHYVEFGAGDDKVVLYNRATGKETILPLYHLPKETGEEGEVRDDKEVFPNEFIKWFESMHQIPHLSHCLRIANFTEFKTRANWPHTPSFTFERNECKAEKLVPSWKRLEEKKSREAIIEYCVEQAKTYTDIKIVNILNKIQLVTDPDEYEKIKAVTIEQIAGFAEETRLELIKCEPERKKLEEKMRRYENADKVIKKVNYDSTLAADSKPKLLAPLPQSAPLVSPQDYYNKKQPLSTTTPFQPFPTPPSISIPSSCPVSSSSASQLGSTSKSGGESQSSLVPQSGPTTQSGSVPQSGLTPQSGIAPQSSSAPPSGSAPSSSPKQPSKTRNNSRWGATPAGAPNANLEASAKNLTQLGNLLTKINDDERLVGLDKQQDTMLRKLIPVYNKLQEKQALLEDLASREARLRERTHKPIGKLLSILEAANTAAVSDLYYLFTKANMKYRPRTVRVETDEDASYGFRVQQIMVGGQKIFYFSSVTERSPADRAGLCQGDRLVEVNEKNVENVSYEELTRRIGESDDKNVKQGPNGERRKQIVMLLSDPETDEYIQQKLDLPVVRFQVQSNVQFAEISTEWLKFRKKQKQRNLGFFTHDQFSEKLSNITPTKPASPLTKSPPPPPPQMARMETGSIHSDEGWKSIVSDASRKRRRSRGGSIQSVDDFSPPPPMPDVRYQRASQIPPRPNQPHYPPAYHDQSQPSHYMDGHNGNGVNYQTNQPLHHHQHYQPDPWMKQPGLNGDRGPGWDQGPMGGNGDRWGNAMYHEGVTPPSRHNRDFDNRTPRPPYPPPRQQQHGRPYYEQDRHQNRFHPY